MTVTLIFLEGHVVDCFRLVCRQVAEAPVVAESMLIAEA